jgi:hypothetical protein
MDLASLSKDFDSVVSVSLMVSVGLVAWKFITSSTSDSVLQTAAYAMEGAASAPAQETQSQPTSAQEEPEEESEEEEEEAEPRGGSCGAAQMNQLNTVSCLQGFSSHQSPLQYSAGLCTCLRCRRSVPAGNPFP